MILPDKELQHGFSSVRWYNTASCSCDVTSHLFFMCATGNG